MGLAGVPMICGKEMGRKTEDALSRLETAHKGTSPLTIALLPLRWDMSQAILSDELIMRNGIENMSGWVHVRVEGKIIVSSILLILEKTGLYGLGNGLEG